MTQVENHPVRWCPMCCAPSDLSEDVWQEIEQSNEEVVCSNCLQVLRRWLRKRKK